jgi:hypothetical protein
VLWRRTREKRREEKRKKIGRKKKRKKKRIGIRKTSADYRPRASFIPWGKTKQLASRGTFLRGRFVVFRKNVTPDTKDVAGYHISDRYY